MGKYLDALTHRVRQALRPHGAVADFCRKTGLHRSGVDKWFDEPVNVTVETLEKIADGLSTTPAELMAVEQAQGRGHRLRNLIRDAVGDALRQRRETPAPMEEGLTGARRELIELLAPLDEAKVSTYVDMLRSGLAAEEAIATKQSKKSKKPG